MARKDRFPDKGKRQQPRRVAERDLRPRLLIVCGGKQTEPNYFRSFRVHAVIEVVGIGKDPRSLIREAEKKQKSANQDGQPYDEVWVVFDRDDYLAADFNAAIQLAKEAKMYTAWSNEAFELWYVLHFDYVHTGLRRDQYIERLNKCLGHPYTKNSLKIYAELASLQENALRNAERLLSNYSEHIPPAEANPCTTVFQLISRLRDLQ